jgi:amino acid transporter
LWPLSFHLAAGGTLVFSGIVIVAVFGSLAAVVMAAPRVYFAMATDGLFEGQRHLYPIEYAMPVHPTLDGESAGIVDSHSLIPDALYHAFATFGSLMSPDLPLERRQHEMIATMVSVTNRCHAEFLRGVTLDEGWSGRSKKIMIARRSRSRIV